MKKTALLLLSLCVFAGINAHQKSVVDHIGLKNPTPDEYIEDDNFRFYRYGPLIEYDGHIWIGVYLYHHPDCNCHECP